MSKKTVVTTPRAPQPAHTFSQGVQIAGMFQVSGQGPVDPETNTYIAAGDVYAQTIRTLENIRAILDAGGASVEDVLMFRVYLTTREDFPRMNEAYGDFLAKYCQSNALPSRTTLIAGLPREEMLVEVDALAVQDPG